MTTIYDVPLEKFQNKLVEELKKVKEIQIPEWSRFVKTGTNKERTPVQKDWWFIRAGSILKQIYKKGPIGVNKLRIRYGSKKNRGDIPEKFYKASGKVIRTILQQIESAGLIEQRKEGSHKGRVVTNKGKSFMDKIASSIRIKKDIKAKIPPKQKEHKVQTKEKKETEVKDKSEAEVEDLRNKENHSIKREDGKVQKTKQEGKISEEKPSN